MTQPPEFVPNVHFAVCDGLAEPSRSPFILMVNQPAWSLNDDSKIAIAD
jgi:hypothetical protein